MSDTALRQTIRRSVAFLSIPLWLLVVQMHNLQNELIVYGQLPSVLTFYLPAIVVVVLAAYLFISVLPDSEPVELDRDDTK